MSEELNHDQTPFETALRKLTPSVGELSAEETFYAAGWNAARKAQQPRRRYHEIRGFAMGMVCSLACCAVGIHLWPAAKVSEQPQITESFGPQPDVSTEITAVPSESDDEVATPPESGGLDEVFALLSPASWFAVEQDARLQESRTISRAAAMGVDVNSLWNMASMERTPMKVPHAATPENRDAESHESLRAFPVPPDAFDEWL